jgi:hypothetical protein
MASEVEPPFVLFLLPKTKGGSAITPASRASPGTPIFRFAPVAMTFPWEFRLHHPGIALTLW